MSIDAPKYGLYNGDHKVEELHGGGRLVPGKLSNVERFIDWMKREADLCKEQGYLSKDGLYERLKTEARSFHIDPELAAKLIVEVIEI